MTTLAFIMAASHSGSTLTAFLLGAHPDATTIGDTAGTAIRRDPDYRCSCGTLARECSFWQRLAQAMAARGFEFDIGDFGTSFRHPQSKLIDRILRAEYRSRPLELLRDGLLGLSSTWRRRSREIMTRNVALAELATGMGGSRVFVDSSKLPHRAKFLLRIPQLRVKVIHLVRDGRGVAETYLRWNGWSMRKAATEWKRSIVAAGRLLVRLEPSRWTEVRYEELCSNPRGELERLCTFLGLDPERVVLDFRSAELHVFGNGMRLESQREVILDDRWKTELNSDDLSTFERVAGTTNRKLGYE